MNIITTVTRAACSAFTPEEGDICTYPECKCQGVPDLCKVGILALLDAIREPSEAMVDAGLVEFAKDTDTPVEFVTAIWRAMIAELRKEIGG